jgi:predicted phosphodiesterase
MPAGKQRLSEIVGFAKEHGDIEACAKYNLSMETFKRYVRAFQNGAQVDSEIVASDKKEGVFDWREWCPVLKQRQDLHEKASWSQSSASIDINTKFRYLVIKPLSDMHLGDIGVDYERLVDFTNSLLEIPYLYTTLHGDETDNFVSFKNQLPVVTQLLSPEEQDEFLESWMNEISPRVLFSTWGNHAEFSERSAARNPVKQILNRNAVYFNGIGYCSIKINGFEYRFVTTHTTRYGSSFNKTHGLKQMMRKDAPDADIYLAGHIHDPAYEWSFERGAFRLFMVMGTLKIRDSYSQRYFSYFTARQDGAIVLDSSEKRIIPFPSLGDALEFAKAGNGV